jgi:hypothetical protein
MATYVNDLRLTELATGEGSGSWGTTTNLSLELIGEALGYATQQSFGSDADATTTVADGASDPARAMYFKITSAGSLTATRTLTIAPNTISRVMFIENATTGSQSIIISQGSGASVTILTGKTAVVYLDGAGAAAAVVDAMASVDPGVTDTLAEVLAAGNTSGGTNIELSTTDKVQFRDAAIYINSSVDGQLDIVADTEIQIAATTVDLNGNLDVSGTALVTGVLTTTAATVFNGGFASNADSTLGTDKKVQFRDAAIYINSSVDGQLDIVADTEIQIAATTVDLNGNLDVSGTALVTGVLTTTAATVFNGGFASNADSTLGTDKKVQFRDAAIYINSSVDGQLDIVADTEIQIAATTIDINGNADVSGTLGVTGNVEFNGLNPTVTYDFNGSGTVTSADALAYLKLGSGISTGVDISATPVVAPSWSAATGTVYADNKFRILAAKGNSTDASAVATAGSASGYGDTVVIGNVDVNGVDTKLITGLGINGELITLAGNATATGTLAVAGEITANGGIALGDNDKATFGSSDDLQIYHNANQSFIEDAGTGDLYIRAADNLRIQSYGDNEDMIKAVKDGAVTLYHNNATRLATTVTGIDISGTVTATGTSVFASLDISGDIDVDGTSNLDILDVDGAVNFAADVTFADGADIITATAGTSNLRLGVNAGNSIESGGNYNTVVGDEAGTALTTGDNNVAVGYNSLASEDTGSANTAIGRYALSALNNDAVSYNTAVGFSAGAAVTTGTQNTLIGGLAGDAITTASNNTAVGYSSLGANTTANYNVAVGHAALGANSRKYHSE